MFAVDVKQQCNNNNNHSLNKADIWHHNDVVLTSHRGKLRTTSFKRLSTECLTVTPTLMRCIDVGTNLFNDVCPLCIKYNVSKSFTGGKLPRLISAKV